MKRSIANVCLFAVTGASLLSISLMTTVAEDDAELLKRAQELFQPLPKDMATPEFPVTKEHADLGRQLFFDPRLTVDGSMSCASCRQPAFFGTDALPTSIGVRQRQHPRDAPTILNSGLNIIHANAKACFPRLNFLLVPSMVAEMTFKQLQLDLDNLKQAEDAFESKAPKSTISHRLHEKRAPTRNRSSSKNRLRTFNTQKGLVMPRILSGIVLEQRPFSRELVACDPTGLTTLAIPLQPDQGVLLPGTLVVLDGSRALLPGHAAGVLSMTVDTDGMRPDRAYAIYTRGRFSWRAVTSANSGMVFDELSIAGLKALGIDFEAVFSGAPERWISLPH